MTIDEAEDMATTLAQSIDSLDCAISYLKHNSLCREEYGSEIDTIEDILDELNKGLELADERRNNERI